MMPGASGPMRGMRGNVRGRGGRGGNSSFIFFYLISINVLYKLSLLCNINFIKINFFTGFLPQSGYASGGPGYGFGGKFTFCVSIKS